jgi:hypothetical protein
VCAAGEGVYRLSCGDTYTGEYVLDKKDGHGVFESAEGTYTVRGSRHVLSLADSLTDLLTR